MITRRLLLPVLAALPFHSSSPPEIVPRVKRTRIVFGGDVMLSRYVGRLARTRRDPSSPLRELAPFLSQADIAFVNLEAPFSDHGPAVDRGMVFKAEPEMIAALELAGVDVVSTANNHARDCGRHGVAFTLDWLCKHGIAAVGSGASAEAAHGGAILARNGLRFGFLGYTFDQSNGNHPDLDERVVLMDLARLRQDVAAMLTRADVTIVSMHAGFEYAARPNRQQMEFARAAIDAGARVVVGHHPHVVQPRERYGRGVIFYSLGNLVFDQVERAETRHGALAEVVFQGAALERAELMPVDIIETVPRLASAAGESRLEG